MAESLRERLMNDLKSAMRAGDVTARETIRFTLAALKNAEIEKRGDLTPDEEIALLRRQEKRLNESIEQFQNGNRPDLVERESAQLQILLRYLPVALSDQELDFIVDQTISESGAAGVRDMGKVMPLVIEQVAGRADGKRISSVVKAALLKPT